MSRHHLEGGGKRIRAVLPLAVAEALGKDTEYFVTFGAACELLHNATLVHDDLQDGDTVRRDRSTVWSEFGPAQAINLGDALFFIPLQIVLEIKTNEQTRLQLVETMVGGMLQAIQGQTMEFLLKGSPDITRDEYFSIVAGKTSALFGIPLQGALILAGESESVVSQMSVAARHLGIAFQIQDDVLDLVGDKGRGQQGNDLREGKPSLPVAYAIQCVSPLQRAKILEVVRAPREKTGDSDVREITQLLIDCGAVEASIAEIERLRHQVEASAGNPRLAALLHDLASEVLPPLHFRI